MRGRLVLAGVTGTVGLLVGLYVYNPWLCFVVMLAMAVVAAALIKNRQDHPHRHHTSRPANRAEVERWATENHLVSRGDKLGRKAPVQTRAARTDWH